MPTVDVTNSKVASASGAPTSLTIPNHSIVAGSNRVLMVVAGSGDTGHEVPTGVTWNGIAMTLVPSSYASAAAWCGVSLWYLLEASLSTATADVVITWAATPQDLVGGVSFVVTDVDQVTPFGTANTGTGASATASAAISSASGEVVIGGISSDSEGSINETGTLIQKVLNVNFDSSFGAQYYSGASSVTIQWGQANTNWAVSGVSLKPAGGGGPPPSPLWAQSVM